MEDTLRFLIVIALVGLLLLLRFDAHRFGTAEYDDETANGGVRPWLRRLAWYSLGAVLIYAVFRVHPQPISVLHLDLGRDRQLSIGLGLLLGLLGTSLAFAFAWVRYRRFRLPPARHYPGAAVNVIGTAVLDEALFRGIILGLLLSFSWPVELAIAFQAAFYGLATRLGAPGRSRGMLIISVGIGAVAGSLTVQTLGIGAAIVGHAMTRCAIFLATGHAGQVRPSGREPEEQLGRSMPPDGWEVVTDRANAATDADPASDAHGEQGGLRPVRPG